jgi:hypothetical protein
VFCACRFTVQAIPGEVAMTIAVSLRRSAIRGDADRCVSEFSVWGCKMVPGRCLGSGPLATSLETPICREGCPASRPRTLGSSSPANVAHDNGKLPGGRFWRINGLRGRDPGRPGETPKRWPFPDILGIINRNGTSTDFGPPHTGR